MSREMFPPPEFPEEKYCPKCNRPFSIYPAHHKGHESDGICDECWEYDQPLQKVKGTKHYVPWNYRFDGYGNGEKSEEYHDDIYAELPKLRYDVEKGKWYVEFQAADFGGYDVTMIKWYYDSIDDYIAEIKDNIEEETKNI